MGMGKLLSVVVPCYNEQEVILETYTQLVQELERIVLRFDLSYELIFINDGSRDRTLPMLHELHAQHKTRHLNSRGEIMILSLARNFGHQIALSAGLANARGDAIVAIDADLQDPPAVIERMVEKWQEGVDVAYGVRSSRAGESWFKLFTARLFYKIVRRLTRVDIPLDTGDFRLMSRRALDVFNSMPERHRFIRGMIPWLGFRQEPVPYDRAARFAGVTKYPLSKMLKLALDGITSFSNAPLNSAYWLGMGVAVISVLYAVYVIVGNILGLNQVRGWPSLMVAILFLGAVQLITIGILGEYVGRIYDEVKKRPLFIMDERDSRRNP
jgi:glycosyltransferase involved in cell wall biosynthesis